MGRDLCLAGGNAAAAPVASPAPPWRDAAGQGMIMPGRFPMAVVVGWTSGPLAQW